MNLANRTIGVIVVAAGSGRRFGSSELPKQFQPLAGRPVLSWAIQAFVGHPSVGRVVAVLPSENFEKYRDLMTACTEDAVYWVAGGESRQESVRCGLKMMEAGGGDFPWVAVHDGARPLIDAETIGRVFDAAVKTGAAIPTLALIDTLKTVDAESHILETVERGSYARAQTPQCFRADWLMQAFDSAEQAGYVGTDESSLVERLGKRVASVAGSEANLKITKPSDLALVEWLVQTGGSGKGQF